MKKDVFVEVSLTGKQGHSDAYIRAHDFLVQNGFPQASIASFDEKTKFRLSVYVRSLTQVNKIKNKFSGESIRQVALKVKKLKPQDWRDKWKRDYGIMMIGRKWILVPEIRKKEYVPGKRIPILLDPRSSFGAGTHESTQSMLKLIEKAKGLFTKVLDLGTGTGILACAAWKLGAKEISAVDLETLAVQTAKANLKRNGCEKAKVFHADLNKIYLSKKWDFVTANLTSTLLLKLRSKLLKWTKRGGLIGVSGILTRELDSFLKEFSGPPLEKVHAIKGKKWAGVLFRRD